eukprot:maker-scaffold361_size196684-snap-gene-0.25 protein:Tk09271 transcript:maker-scaffold361_size196684-snap-gene-0.25-mRNA-1 annotation:"protein fam115c-like"
MDASLSRAEPLPPPWYEAHFRELVRAISELDMSNWVASAMTIFGEKTFPIGVDSDGDIVIAAAEHGKGRVLMSGRSEFFYEKDKPSMEAFAKNTVKWIANGKENPRIASVDDSGIFTDIGGDVIKNYKPEDLTKNEIDILLIYAKTVKDSEISTIVDFVTNGGGLVIAGQCWSWAPAETRASHCPFNKLLIKFGAIVDWQNRADTQDVQQLPHESVHLLKAWKTIMGGTKDAIANRNLKYGMETIITPETYTLPEIAPLWKKENFDFLAIAPDAKRFPGLVPEGSPRVTQTLQIDGTTKREHTDEEWMSSIKSKPAPWGELQVPGQISFVISSALIQHLKSPNELMNIWNTAMIAANEFAGFGPTRIRMERAAFDVQISAGGMHSGYPIMAGVSAMSYVLDPDVLKAKGTWGMFHELGHNHQWQSWTVAETTQTGCNLWSVVMNEAINIHDSFKLGVERLHAFALNGRPWKDWNVWLAFDTYYLLADSFGWDSFTAVIKTYYDEPVIEKETQRLEEFAFRFITQVKTNLCPFFEWFRHPLNQQTKTLCQTLPTWEKAAGLLKRFEHPEPAVTCPEGWFVHGKECFFIGEDKQNWYEADFACRRIGGHLASCLTEKEFYFLFTKKPTGFTWLGISDVEQTGSYANLDGSKISLALPWDDQYPKSTTKRLSVGMNKGMAQNADSSDQYPYACKSGPTACHTDSTTCPEGWVSYGKSCLYMGTDTQSWLQAEAKCQSMGTGSQLASCLSNSEIGFLKTKTKAMLPSGFWWVGIHGLTDGKNFVKLDGKAPNANLWYEGHPEDNWEHRCAGISAPTSCPEDWISFGESCFYLGRQELNWFDADKKCKEMGNSHLASCLPPSEMAFLSAKVKDEKSRYWWLGQSNWDDNAQFVNLDGSQAVSTVWAQGQPKDVSSMHCAAIWGYYGYSLGCSEARSFICKSGPSACSQPASVNCPEGWASFGTSCFFLGQTPLGWQEAESKCQELGNGHLASCLSSSEAVFLGAKASEQSSTDYWWIGINDFDKFDTFANLDGTSANDVTWASGYPAQGQGYHCAGFWGERLSNWKCEARYKFICKTGPTACAHPDAAKCPKGWTFFRGSCYNFAFEKGKTVTHSAAQASCQSFDAHLAEIDNADESKFLIDAMIHIRALKENGFYSQYWIGKLLAQPSSIEESTFGAMC